MLLSPAGAHGSFAPGERTGSYRVGGEVALFDAEGNSNLSGADLAIAVVDEIETPAHHRAHIGVAYEVNGACSRSGTTARGRSAVQVQLGEPAGGDDPGHRRRRPATPLCRPRPVAVQ